MQPLDPLRITAEMFPTKPETKDVELADSIGQEPVTTRVSWVPYVPSAPLIEAVNMAIALGRTLLLQGEPGCGKTMLAHAVAYALGFPLEDAYLKSTSRAQDLLYTFDAVRQLYDVQKNQPREPKDYFRLGPLGRAIARACVGRRSVVLLDEIDKADLDYPNDLLLELDRLMFRVPELDEKEYAAPKEKRPLVIVTHNEEKPLPSAFLRRCVFFYVKFDDNPRFLSQLLEIHGRLHASVADEAIRVLLELRKLDLAKKPGLSELLEWVGYLDAVQTPVDVIRKLPHLGILLKQLSDQNQVHDKTL
ncbi:MAG: MoxR family ATPase [Deltaproteobacteria bacterium]|nr:MoxR family ATPase [Deltaproteobacteria bacterium]